MVILILAFLAGVGFGSFDERWFLRAAVSLWALVMLIALRDPTYYTMFIAPQAEGLVYLAGATAGFQVAETTRKLMFD